MIDSRKKDSRSPLNWIYGVSYPEGVLTYRLAGVRDIVYPLKTRAAKLFHHEYAAALSLVAVNVLLRSKGKDFWCRDLIHIYACKDLSPPEEYSFRRAVEVAVSKATCLSVSFDLVNRATARAHGKLWELYQRAHRAAKRKEYEKKSVEHELFDSIWSTISKQYKIY